jgi:SulP family sulfate permease
MILANSTQIISLLIISIFSMLFITSGIETTIHRDIDLDRELQSAGYANLAAAIGGSPTGYHALSFSTLTYQMNASNRLVGIISATCIGLVLFFGLSLMEYVPLAVVGGILIFLGLSFLIDWLYEGKKSLPVIDYLLMLIIVAIIVVFGFLEGIIAGIGVAVILFVYNYSKLDIVKHRLSGDAYRSKINRSRVQRDYLREHGAQILVLELQGYLFFGTAFNLLTTVRSRFLDENLEPLRYLVIDFRLVDGLDTSATYIFNRIWQFGNERSFHLIISNTSPRIKRQLINAGLSEQKERLIFVPSLDHGLEFSENRLLNSACLTDKAGFLDLRTQLNDVFLTSEDTEEFFKYLEFIEINPGQYLINQGDPSDHIYFVESGMLSVLLELSERRETRVTTMQAGTIVGEIGFYLGIDRTASVIATEQSRLYRLSNKSYKLMELENPRLAAAIHQWVVKILAERLSDNIKTLEVLLD